MDRLRVNGGSGRVDDAGRSESVRLAQRMQLPCRYCVIKTNAQEARVATRDGWMEGGGAAFGGLRDPAGRDQLFLPGTAMLDGSLG